MNAFACSLALSAGIAFTGAPAAGERVETVVQDDAALLYRAPPRCGARSGGCPNSGSTGSGSRPAGASWRRGATRAANPPSTPPIRPPTTGAALARLDTAVDGARARGMKVMLDLGFFAPRWAVQRGGRAGRNVWRPSVREYRLYARAMAPPLRRPGAAVDDVERAQPPGLPAPAVGSLGRRVATGHAAPLPAPAQGRLRRGQGESGAQPRAHRRAVVVREPGPRAGRGMAPLRFTRELACVDAGCARCAGPSAAASGRCAPTASRSTRTRWTRHPRPPTRMPTGSRWASWPS